MHKYYNRIHFQRFHRIRVPIAFASQCGTFRLMGTFRWKYRRGEEQNKSKRGAHAVVYLPVCGICSHFARINSRLLEFAPNLLQI